MKYFEEYLAKFREPILSGKFRRVLFLGPQAIGKSVSAMKLQGESAIPIFIIHDIESRRELFKPTIYKVDDQGRYIHLYTANKVSKARRGFFDLIVEVK
jgi:hypothetical protein